MVDALNLGLLVIRLGIGLILAAHGAQKLFGWFGGYEMPLRVALAAFATAFAGPGRLSLDFAFGLQSLDSAIIVWIGLVLALLGALGTMVLRPPVAQPTGNLAVED